MKIRLAEAELLHADGRADMTELTILFRKFVKAPKADTSGTVSATFWCFCV